MFLTSFLLLLLNTFFRSSLPLFFHTCTCFPHTFPCFLFAIFAYLIPKFLYIVVCFWPSLHVLFFHVVLPSTTPASFLVCILPCYFHEPLLHTFWHNSLLLFLQALVPRCVLSLASFLPSSQPLFWHTSLTPKLHTFLLSTYLVSLNTFLPSTWQLFVQWILPTCLPLF